tara:strand:+ start:10234 stop:12573 length:2340 start_codon:yes stop_codon:yes gene_type:complete
MPIEITRPDMSLIDPATNTPISSHRSEVEAMETASELAPGTYRLDRPAATIVVTGGADTDVDPDIVDPPLRTVIRFMLPDGEVFEEPIMIGASYPMSHAEAQSMLLEVEADTGPVEFAWADQHHIENNAPYQMNGDDRYVAFDAGVHDILITAGDVQFTVSIHVDEALPGEVIPGGPDPVNTQVISFSRQQYEQSHYDPQGKIDEIKAKFELLPRDSNGWTIINSNPANLVGYVDSVDGVDSTAWLAPQGTPPASVGAFKTLNAALDALPKVQIGDELKSGAHHLYLHDDQAFSTKSGVATRIPSGENRIERLVIGRYGDGAEPPVIDDFGSGEIRFWGTCRFVIVQGVNLDNKFRDPGHPEFVGWGNTSGDVKGGFICYSGEIGSSDILLEGCNMNFCGMHLTGRGHSQILAYRCVVKNTYSETSHQQGMFVGGTSEMLFDECIFDHDGWFKQRGIDVPLNTQAEGSATWFNHDTYISGIHILWMRNPIFLRASSIGTKLTASTAQDATADTINASHILIENPYYLHCEIGISAGGNRDHNSGPRWEYVFIVDPVFEATGHDQPTNRSLGWGLDIQDWSGGAVVNPLFIGGANDKVTNTYAVSISGHCDGVKILNTIAYDVGAKNVATGAYAVRYREQGQSVMSGIVEEGSIVQNPNSKSKLLLDDVINGVTRKDCIYYSNNLNKDELFKFDEVYHGVEGAMAHPSMVDCRYAEVVFSDPTRSIKTYMASLGLEPSAEAFAAECGKQNIINWRPEFTAQAVNQYLREGFTPTGLKVAA